MSLLLDNPAHNFQNNEVFFGYLSFVLESNGDGFIYLFFTRLGQWYDTCVWLFKFRLRPSHEGFHGSNL